MIRGRLLPEKERRFFREGIVVDVDIQIVVPLHHLSAGFCLDVLIPVHQWGVAKPGQEHENPKIEQDQFESDRVL